MSDMQNVGGVDRVVRGIAGAALIAVAFTELGLLEGNMWGILAGVAGLVLLGTAAVRFCPAYLPFRISTCKPAAR
jgi:hypothetical protein